MNAKMLGAHAAPYAGGLARKKPAREVSLEKIRRSATAALTRRGVTQFSRLDGWQSFRGSPKGEKCH